MQAKPEAKMTWLTALTVKWGPFFIEINSFYMKYFKCTVVPFLNVNHSLYFEQGRHTVIQFAVFFQSITQSSTFSKVLPCFFTANPRYKKIVINIYNLFSFS